MGEKCFVCAKRELLIDLNVRGLQECEGEGFGCCAKGWFSTQRSFSKSRITVIKSNFFGLFESFGIKILLKPFT